MLQPEAPVSPQVVLSDDGDLSFHIGDISQPYLGYGTNKEQVDNYAKYLQEELQRIAETPGLQVQADVYNQTYVSTNVHDHLAQFFNIRGDHHLKHFLRTIQRLLPYHLADGIDHVFTLDSVTEHGLSGLLFPQMQRWLLAGGLTEEVAAEATNAMALPFSKDVQRRVRLRQNYQSVSIGQGVEAHCMTIVAKDSTFSVMRERQDIPDYDEPEMNPTQYGNVVWRNLSMSTLGNCACWGVEGMELGHPPLLEYDHLYEMGPHNVDFARQAVSHLLGAAVLSRHAAAYQGREDVYAHAVWLENE